MVYKNFKKIGIFPIIFIIMVSWIFSGWPPIDTHTEFDFPPKVEHVEAAATPGDYFVVRNDSDSSSTITTSNFDAPWDTEVDSSGTSISYASSTGTFTLDTGKYLVMYSERFHQDSAVNNNRREIQGRLVVGGTATTTGAGQAYIRGQDGSSGDWQDDAIVHGAGIIDVTSASTSLLVRFYRTDTSVTGNVSRVADWGGVTVVALDDTWNYARYETTSNKATAATEGTWTDIIWDNNTEQDTGFSRSSGDITITSAGRYIVTVSVPIQGGTNRSEFNGRLTLDGTEVEGTEVTTYLRDSQDTNDGVLTYAGIIDVAASDILTLEHRQNEGTGSFNYLSGSSIQIVQLPSGNETIIAEATTGEMNPSTLTEFSWDTTAHIDTNGFTMANGTDSFFEVDLADEYLIFATQKSDQAGSRTYATGRFSVNDTIQSQASAGEYGRNNGTADHVGFSFGTLLTGLSAGDDISLENIYIEDTRIAQTVNHGAISALRLGSVFGSGDPTTRQLHFRWRDDTTDINTSGGWLAAEDSNVIGDGIKEDTYRLRFYVANNGTAVEAAARSYEIQYGKKDSTSCGSVSVWAGIADSSDAFDMVVTAHISPDGETTSALLANTEAFTFTAGEGRESADTTGTIGPMAVSTYTELEYSFEPTNSAIDGATYCFRLYDTNNSELLNSYVYPEITMDADYVFRSTEYYLTSGDFTGTTYDLTLDQDLAEDYFVLVRGSQVGDGAGIVDSHYARVYEVPGGKGDLASSGANDVIALSRHVADSDWEGVVTVVEALNVTSTKSFHLLDIIETSIVGTATTGTSTSANAWKDINQVVPFGGYKGGGVEYEYDAANTEHDSSATQLRVSGTDSLVWERVNDTEQAQALGSVTMTTFLVEWGSEWTVQHAHVSGTAAGDGANVVAEYNTSTINSVVRDNTWVWGTGTSEGSGIGDIAEGSIVTLGDGVTPLANETMVAVGAEYPHQRETDIYVMSHPDLAVDYRFKADADTNELDLAVTVDSATDGVRMSLVYNGCNGSGTAHPRTQFWSRYTGLGEITMSRGYDGQAFPAWVQGIDFAGLSYFTPAASISLDTDGAVNFGHLALGSTEDNTATGINDVESITVDVGPADLSILTSNFSTGAHTWSMGASNGANQVQWEFASTTPNWTTFLTKGAYYDFDANVATSSSRDINLRITMPSTSDTLDPYAADIIILVTEP